MSRLGRVGNAALWLGAVAGAGCLLLMVLGPLLGLRPLLFRSGSMSPAIETGDVAIARTVPAADLATGDIVSVIAESGQRVTHRVVGVETKGDAAVLRLKGDANNSADQESYLVSEADRIWFVVPWIGYPIAWLSSPVGLLGLGMGASALLFLAIRGRKPGEPPAQRPGRGRRRATRSAVTASAAAVLMVSGPAMAAAWVDDVAINGTALTAYTVPAPVASCGLLSVGRTNVNWTAVPGATSYTVHYGSGGGTSATVPGGTTSYALTGLISGGTFFVEANINYGSTTWTSVSSNSLSYTVLLALVGLCS